MIKKLNSKCTSCGGNLVFSPENNCVLCENCNKAYKIEAKKEHLKFPYTQNEENLNFKTKTTNCSNCGALVTLNPREITKTCPYCGSNFVLEKEEMVGLSPNGIIPFKFNKQKAIEYYLNGVKKKRFLPNKFKKSPTLGSISATYIPCFSFDCNTESSYSGRLSYTETDTDSNGNRHSHTYYKNIKGTKEMAFENVIVESGEQTVQHLFEQIEPYNHEEVYEYNPDFLRGYNAESYNNTLKNCKILSNNLIEQRIKRAILSKYTYDRVEYFSMHTNYSNERFSYLLLPVYFINFSYKEKNYKTYINGQTGKIGDDLPKSKVKKFFAILLPIILFAAIFLTVYFLAN